MDFQKYMPQYGSKKDGSQGGGYQQYMDYQKYMSAKTEFGSETSSRKRWCTLLFLAASLPAAVVVIHQRRYHSSFGLMKMSLLGESFSTMPLLHKFRGGLVEDDMTGYRLQTK